MTGIQPDVLLDDPVMYAAAAEQAEAARWTDLHELLAVNAELTHACLRQLIASAGNKPPDAWVCPRPKGVRAEDEPIVMRPSEFGKMLASR